MKKLISVILTTLFFFLWFLPCAFASDVEDKTHKFYAINVEDPQWKEFQTSEEMYKALYIEESFFDNVPTRTVLEAVLEYPLITDIWFFDSLEKGIEQVSLRCTALRVFLNRSDAENVLLHTDDQQAEKNLRASTVAKESTSLTLRGIRTYLLTQDELQSSVNATSTVYTPKGSAVTVYTYSELSQAEINRLNNSARTSYPNAQFVSNSSRRYNCHSFAWYSTSTSNPYWMNNPAKYMSDGSYTKVTTINKASKVYYTTANHSANVYDATGNSVANAKVKSKWGQGPVMIHSPRYGPYSGTLTFWKR